MNRLFRSAEGILCVVLIVLLVICLLGVGGVIYLEQSMPVFQNVTMELDQPLPPVSAFLTERGNPDRAYMVTPEAQIDLTRTGKQQITLSHNGREETVTLEIRDTVAPAVVSRMDVNLPLGSKPQPQDLIALVTDHSPVTISFGKEPEIFTDYGTVEMEVAVTDAAGNSTVVTCNVHYVWLKDSVTLELGDTLEIADLLLRQEDAALFTDQATVDDINASGVDCYFITSTYGDVECRCMVIVQDTVAPSLEVRPLVLELGETAAAEDFVVSSTDISGEVDISFHVQPDFEQVGTQTVTVEARDASGNVTTAETQLEIRHDITAPVFQGVENMRVEIGSSPDYSLGVVAVDNRDGYVEFTYDASQEDTSKSGGFYVTYTATDKAGNTATIRRWIIVDHDQADIDALVAKYADTLPDDPHEISIWLQRNIWYTGDWGNGDPVWFGFTNWVGNCYVHAHCLQAILENKGYETHIAWTTEKSHYWVIVKVGDDLWRHLDSTPGEIHTQYGLMDDWQRLATLSGGRTWDFTQWPSCDPVE